MEFPIGSAVSTFVFKQQHHFVRRRISCHASSHISTRKTIVLTISAPTTFALVQNSRNLFTSTSLFPNHRACIAELEDDECLQCQGTPVTSRSRKSYNKCEYGTRESGLPDYERGTRRNSPSRLSDRFRPILAKGGFNNHGIQHHRSPSPVMGRA